MTIPLVNHLPHFALTICLLTPLQRAEAQFVEVTAKVEVNDWDYFFAAKTYKYPSQDTPPSVFTKSHFIRCIVSANTWLMEGEIGRNAIGSWWFTGTNRWELQMTIEGRVTSIQDAAQLEIPPRPDSPINE